MSVEMRDLIALSLLLAACSNDPGSEPRQVSPDASVTPDTSQGGDDLGSPNNGGEPDLGNVEDTGQGADTGTPGTDMAAPEDMGSGGDDLYVGSGDPYALGALGVTEFEVAEGEGGAPNDLVFFAPSTPGTYALVAFQHGFLLRNTFYSELLTHLASHGFVVVAPQMYAPSFGSAPSTADEAQDAIAVWDWAKTNAASVTAVSIAPAFGVAGHSRGGKAMWIALESGYTGALAAAGVDPVDGTGGPLGGEARVLDGGLSASLPSLTIGAALSRETTFGMACAPQGDDHEAFYAAVSAPAWWAFAEDYGHLDMLNENPAGCGFTYAGCVDGPADGGMRTFTGGQLVAFFRMQLQGVTTDAAVLDGTTAPPIDAQFQSR